MAKYVMALDAGTTSNRCILFNEKGEMCSVAQKEFTQFFPKPGWVEHDADEIWSTQLEVAKEAMANVGATAADIGAIGISAMMHGYMAFNENDEILVPFRTWRNTNTAEAAAALSELFVYNIPLRWSISHLYQCILDNDAHVKDIDFQTTLAGYIHWQLTGKKVLGVGDASGMIPVDPETKTYNATMVEKFNNLIAPKGYNWTLLDIFPEVLVAGENAGYLTEEGAKKLDVSGHLKAGVPVCPPAGDAGTGMVATNAVARKLCHTIYAVLKNNTSYEIKQ